MNKILWFITIVLCIVCIVSFSVMRNTEVVSTSDIVSNFNEASIQSTYVPSDALVSKVRRDFFSILVNEKDSFDISISGSEKASRVVKNFRDYLLSVWDATEYESFSDFLTENVSMGIRYDSVSDNYYIIGLYDTTAKVIENIDSSEEQVIVPASACAIVKVKGEVIHEAFYFN